MWLHSTSLRISLSVAQVVITRTLAGMECSGSNVEGVGSMVTSICACASLHPGGVHNCSDPCAARCGCRGCDPGKPFTPVMLDVRAALAAVAEAC